MDTDWYSNWELYRCPCGSTCSHCSKYYPMQASNHSVLHVICHFASSPKAARCNPHEQRDKMPFRPSCLSATTLYPGVSQDRAAGEAARVLR